VADAASKAVRILASGRVQGVGFRYSATRKARSLKLSGWVKNLDDGDVEIFAEGPDETLSRFAEWLRDMGPPARVDRLDIEGARPRGIAGFEIA
jgi:acylphosphatase